MKKTHHDLISTTSRLFSKLGPATRLLDSISNRLLPETTAKASGVETICFYECGTYCNHFGDQILFQVTAFSQADCNAGI
ncbi:MAG TPA: hypothetical protein VFN35_25720, partial [Ktedonobacteraceae bacterium]|nr:hypothetical protein [Ktedonobacteraceae bacterium]